MFDAANANIVRALHDAVSRSGCAGETPHPLKGPGGGMGFGFADPEGRNYAIVCDLADHRDSADMRDRPRKIAHVNINAGDIAKTNAFLVDVLGFKLIDHSGPLHFLHCDSTDHSSMVTGQTGKPTLNHVAFEMPDLEFGDARRRAHARRRLPDRMGSGPARRRQQRVLPISPGPEEFPIEYTGEVLQVDDSYEFHGPDYWKWPPGRLDQWGVTPPHTARWKRIQDMYLFAEGQFRLP